MERHKFEPRWDEHEKANYCTVCGVVEDEHAQFDVSEQLFYVICTKHGSSGSWDILFWRAESCGYTIRLDEAGKYTKDNLPRLHKGDGFAIPCEEVDAVAHRAVDRDSYLFKFMNRHMPKKTDGQLYHYGDIQNG